MDSYAWGWFAAAANGQSAPRQSGRPSWTLVAPWAAGCQLQFSGIAEGGAEQGHGMGRAAGSQCTGGSRPGWQAEPRMPGGDGTSASGGPTRTYRNPYRCQLSVMMLPDAASRTASSSKGLMSTRSCSGSICGSARQCRGFSENGGATPMWSSRSVPVGWWCAVQRCHLLDVQRCLLLGQRSNAVQAAPTCMAAAAAVVVVVAPTQEACCVTQSQLTAMKTCT